MNQRGRGQALPLQTSRAVGVLKRTLTPGARIASPQPTSLLGARGLAAVFAHRRAHGRDDRLAHAALAKLRELRGREVELDRRLLDAAYDRAFGEARLDQLDDRVVRQRRRAFELRLRVAAAFGGRADDADGGAARGLRVVVRAAAPAARAHAPLRAARRAED